MHHQSGRLLEILDSLNIPLLLLDSSGKVKSHNGMVEEIFGYSSADLIGLPSNNLIARFIASESPVGVSSSSPDPFHADLSSPLQREVTCRRKNGGEFPAQVTFIPWGDGTFRLMAVQDVSGQRRLEQRATQRTKELTLFNTFAEILSRGGKPRALLQETVDMLPGILGIKAAMIHLQDQETGNLVPAARQGFDASFLASVGEVEPGQGLFGKVLTSGLPLLVEKASEDPRTLNFDLHQSGLQSFASVPVSSKGAVRGVLTVASRRVSSFTAMDMQLLDALGSQLGIAIENAELIAQLKEKMNQIALTNELSGTINSSLSIGTIFRMMVSEIRKLIEYDRAGLLLYDEKKGNLLIFALDTGLKTEMTRGVKAPIEGTSAGWALKHNRPWINRDLLSEMLFPLDGKLRDEGIRSTISIPLTQEKRLGVFNLDSREAAKYSETDLQILLPVAKQISIALENALLFEEISREKKEWEKTFDAFTDMVWIDDHRQRILRANQALLQGAEVTMAGLSDLHCANLLDRLGVGPSCLCCETVTTQRQTFREVHGREGKIFHFWAYPLLDDEGQLYAVLHYLKDVTERKRLEQQLLRADKLASLVTLVAGIAHEINNPLGIIAGYAEALLDRAGDPALRGMEAFEDFPEYLDTIHKEIFRCKETLGSLLEFARPHGRKSRELDINELLKEVILLVNHKAKRLHCRIEHQLNRELPKICAEPGSLRQLFMNIIINSLYHTPEGGKIEITTELNRNDPKEMIQVAIRDTGPGIRHEVIDKIFDPFFTTKPVGEGTGLGLSICHKIAEEHNGVIDVESEVGRGTTFFIKLPAKGNHGPDTCR
ncbi:MAG: GAF domain-containing protein [Deltaproteobacteria bacterium]|nr:GAF domain-containing protein [Deltaproteobacteria bacterium]